MSAGNSLTDYYECLTAHPFLQTLSLFLENFSLAGLMPLPSPIGYTGILDREKMRNDVESQEEGQRSIHAKTGNCHGKAVSVDGKDLNMSLQMRNKPSPIAFKQTQ